MSFCLPPPWLGLIEKERGGHLVRQGYFPDRPERGTHVQVEGETGQLVLVSHQPNGPVEQATRHPPLSGRGSAGADCRTEWST